MLTIADDEDSVEKKRMGGAMVCTPGNTITQHTPLPVFCLVRQLIPFRFAGDDDPVIFFVFYRWQEALSPNGLAQRAVS